MHPDVACGFFNARVGHGEVRRLPPRRPAETAVCEGTPDVRVAMRALE